MLARYIIPINEVGEQLAALQEHVTRILIANWVFDRREFGAANRNQPIQLRWIIGSMATLGRDPVAKLPLGCPLPCPRNHLSATLRVPT